MTIDERLEKLAERHEALTQTVEIMAGMQRENDRRWAETDKRWAETDKRWAETDKRWAETDKRFAETDRRMSQLMEAINSLANIAGAHEQRLDDLENRR